MIGEDKKKRKQGENRPSTERRLHYVSTGEGIEDP